MAEAHLVKVTIVSQKGTCDVGHREGESWVVDLKTPAGICCEAFHCLWSAIAVYRTGGSNPWDKEPGLTYMACPDPENPIVFEVRRLPKDCQEVNDPD